MYHYYLSLGSNVGNKYNNILKAIDYLKKIKGPRFLQSSFYLTEAQGLKEQDDFLNICVYMDSELNPFELLDRAKKIEKKMGRKSGVIRFGPRVIDIDIIWVKGIEIKSNILEVPHPRAFERAFVLHPLKEVIQIDNNLKNFVDFHIETVKEQRIKKVSEFELKRM